MVVWVSHARVGHRQGFIPEAPSTRWGLLLCARPKNTAAPHAPQACPGVHRAHHRPGQRTCRDRPPRTNQACPRPTEQRAEGLRTRCGANRRPSTRACHPRRIAPGVQQKSGQATISLANAACLALPTSRRPHPCAWRVWTRWAFRARAGMSVRRDLLAMGMAKASRARGRPVGGRSGARRHKRVKPRRLPISPAACRACGPGCGDASRAAGRSRIR